MSLIYPAGDNRQGLVSLTEVNSADEGWDDMQVSVENATGGAALARVTFRDTLATMRAFSDTAQDRLTFYTQMSHQWNRGAVRPHIHWCPLVVPGGARNVRFVGSYVWSRPLQEIPAAAGWTPFVIDVPIAAVDGFKHLITSIAEVPAPATAEASDFLIVVLSRDGAAPEDTYTDGTNNVGIVGLDTHIKRNRMGSLNEFGP